MMDIQNKFKELLDKGNVIKNSFLSTSLDNTMVFRIGIDDEQNPAILISERHFNSSGWSKKNYRFDRLELKFNVSCQVRDIEIGGQIEDVFTIVKQVNGNSRMHEYFFSIAEVMITALKSDLTVTNLNSEIENLIRLFSSNKRVDEKVILGLWGELLFILNSKNVDNAISAWHLDKNDLYDFSFEESIKEIKTTRGNSRTHEFNNAQLKKFTNLNVSVVSILTEKMALGKSVLDLWNDINIKCSSAESRNKITRIISDIVQTDMESLTQFKFNYLMGVSTMREFHSSIIPYIDPIGLPNSIVELRLKINLDLL
jgi:hypothetical protein